MPSNFFQDLAQLWSGLGDIRQEHEIDDEALPTLPSSRRITREATRAALAWLVIYFVLFLSLLGYRWQTQSYYQDEHSRLVHVYEEQAVSHQAEYERALQKRQAQLEKRRQEARQAALEAEQASAVDWGYQEEQLEQASRDLEKAQDFIEDQLQKFAGIDHSLEELETKLNQLSTKRWAQNDDTERANIRTVLSVLRKPRSADHNEGELQRSIEELEATLQEPTRWKWDILHRQLVRFFPPKEPVDYPLQCLDSASDQPAEVEIPRGLARQKDLDRRIHKIDNMLARRNPRRDVPSVLLPDALAEVEKHVSSGAEALLQELMDTAEKIKEEEEGGSSTYTTKTQCSSREDILELINVGMDSLVSGRDLRNVLRAKILEMDPQGGRDLILDMPMPLPKPTAPPTPDSMYLARVVDTPLLIEISDWIDAIVEWSGGYYDPLDQWVDSWSSKNDESIGGMVMQKILSSEVQIPTPQALAKRLPGALQNVLKEQGMI